MMNLSKNCRNHHQRALLIYDESLPFHYVEVVWVDWLLDSVLDWDFDWLTAVSCALVQNWLKIAWVVDLAWIGDLDHLDPATSLNHLTLKQRKEINEVSMNYTYILKEKSFGVGRLKH